MFWGRRKSKNSESYKTLEAQGRWQLYLLLLIYKIIILFKDVVSDLPKKLLRYKHLLQVDVNLAVTLVGEAPVTPVFCGFN